MKRQTEFGNLTVGAKEAAEFLGISVASYERKASIGEAPGSKIGKEWVVLKEDLVTFLRQRYTKVNVINKGTKSCQSVKLKTALTGKPDFKSVEFECKNLRAKLLGKVQNDTKISDDKKSANN